MENGMWKENVKRKGNTWKSRGVVSLGNEECGTGRV